MYQLASPVTEWEAPHVVSHRGVYTWCMYVSDILEITKYWNYHSSQVQDKIHIFSRRQTERSFDSIIVTKYKS